MSFLIAFILALVGTAFEDEKIREKLTNRCIIFFFFALFCFVFGLCGYALKDRIDSIREQGFEDARELYEDDESEGQYPVGVSYRGLSFDFLECPTTITVDRVVEGESMTVRCDKPVASPAETIQVDWGDRCFNLISKVWEGCNQ